MSEQEEVQKRREAETLFFSRLFDELSGLGFIDNYGYVDAGPFSTEAENYPGIETFNSILCRKSKDDFKSVFSITPYQVDFGLKINLDFLSSFEHADRFNVEKSDYVAAYDYMFEPSGLIEKVMNGKNIDAEFDKLVRDLVQVQLIINEQEKTTELILSKSASLRSFEGVNFNLGNRVVQVNEDDILFFIPDFKPSKDGVEIVLYEPPRSKYVSLDEFMSRI